jgi:regulator of sigma E protease
MQLLAIEWGPLGIKIAQFILSLSILIVLHEFGHYITARWFGCRVEKFYLFFDPWFSLFKKKVKDTEYGIGWLPLGGYVKISGMIDESMDTESMKEPPKEYEFRSKPAWQRLIIMLGGIIVNVLLGILIYAFVLQIWGDKKIPTSSMKYGIYVGDSTLKQIGLRTGDKLLSVDGEKVYDLFQFTQGLLTAKNVLIERNGVEQNIPIPHEFLGILSERKNQKRDGFIDIRMPVMVQEVPDSSRGKEIGLQKNDMLIGIDSQRFQFMDEMKELLEANKNKNISLTVLRNNQELVLPASVDSNATIGFVPFGQSYQEMDSLGWCKFEVTKYGFAASFPAAVKKAWQNLTRYGQQLRAVGDVKTGAYKGLGGFWSIINVFPAPWNWEIFWGRTAYISLVLALMNFLPIPALDGGHVMFTLYEMITRRKPNQKFLEYAQMAGMIFLIALMIYANSNDIFGFFTK